MNQFDAIRSMLYACLLGAAGAVCAADSAPTPSLPGQWNATMQTGAGSYALELTVKQDAQGALAASIESVDQAPGQAIPVSRVALDQDKLTLDIQALGAVYEGRFDAQHDTWAGSWRQGRVLPLTWLRGALPPLPNVAGIDGDWRATLNRNGTELRLILHVSTSRRGTTAKLDSPDMGLAGMDVTDLRRDGERVHLRVPMADVVFDGKLFDDATSLSGRWRRQGMPDATVRFARPAAPAATAVPAPTAAPVRPQTPQAPFAYRAEPVRFANAQSNLTLAGTLSVPQGSGPFPGVVLISGSGPQDRDETLFGHKTFAVLADHLTRHGIAVLRFDDRGVGESGGRFDGAGNADFAADVRAAVDFLRIQPGIDTHAVGLIGHSQGGIVGPLAAANNPHVAFLVLLAAPATSLAEVLLAQRRLSGVMQGQSGAALAGNEAALSVLFAASAKAPDRAAARAQLTTLMTPALLRTMGLSEAQKPAIVDELSDDWLRDVLRYDAPTALGALHIPLLALNGSLDRQVPADANLDAIRRASAHNADVTTLQLEGLNHLFQHATSGAIAEYAQISETFAPSALGAISDWIGARFAH